MPGYSTQESFRTAREEWPGEEAPAAEEAAEHTPAAEEPTQAPPCTEPASTAGGPQALPQEGGEDEVEQHAEAEQGAGEWPDVTLPGEMALSTCSADPRRNLASGLGSSWPNSRLPITLCPALG